MVLPTLQGADVGTWSLQGAEVGTWLHGSTEPMTNISAVVYSPVSTYGSQELVMNMYFFHTRLAQKIQ